MRVSFYTFGCTVNQAETQELSRQFTEYGDQVVEDGEADVVIVNSCAITGAAEKGALQLIERQKKKNPHATVVLLGCVVDYLLNSGKSGIPGYDMVLIDKKKQNVLLEVHSLYDQRHVPGGEPAESGKADSTVAFQSPRAFVEIQSGCDNGCTYCVVPHVRGRSVSVPYPRIREKINGLVEQGVREIVFAGLNLGHYNHGGMTLADVLEESNSIQGLESIRLSSLEPMNIGDQFIESLPRITKLNPHLHISLQSGSNRILSLMNRRYTFEEYLSMLEHIRAKVPGIAITTDVIVGFPSESERDFLNSIENIVRCQFSDIHIFKYSQRKGTAAAKMDRQVTEHQKTKRANLLKGVKLQARYSYYAQWIGTRDKAVLLKQQEGGRWEGVTSRNFGITVELPAPVQGIADVELTGMTSNQEAYVGKIIH